MPPVVSAVFGLILTLDAGADLAVAMVIAQTLTYGLVLAAAIVASIFLAPKPSQGSTQIDLKFDPTMARQIVLGNTAVGGSVVFAFTYTDNSTPNDYLVRIISLSDIPCTSLVAITEGSDIYGNYPNVLSFSGDPTTGWVSCNQHQSKGSPRMWVRVYLGQYATSAQAFLTIVSNPSDGNYIAIGGISITFKAILDTNPTGLECLIGSSAGTTAANLQAVINLNASTLYCTSLASGTELTLTAAPGLAGNSLTLSSSSGNVTASASTFSGATGPTADSNLISWSNGQWTTNHVGIGQCYAAVKYQYDTTAFPNGEPQLVFQLNGAAVYDQRQDSTRTNPTRTGSQRLNIPSTWAYSANAAVLCQQVMRGFYLNGKLIYGCGALDQDVPDAMLLAAYNTCDEVVATTTGTELQYQAGGILDTSQTNSQGLADLQAAMDGNLYDRSGVLTILPGGSRTPILNLNDSDVVWEEEKSWQPRAGQDTLFNAVTGTYVPESQQFVQTPFPVLWNDDWETQDGGFRYPRNIAYNMVTSDFQVQRINTRVWNSSRFQGTIAFVLNLSGLQIEQGDWFTFTSARWGFSELYFIAAQVNVLKNMRIQIIGQQISPTIDGWIPAIDYETPTTTTRTPSPGTPLGQYAPSLMVSSSPGTNLVTDVNLTDPFYWKLT